MHLATKWSLITPFYRWPKGGATRFHLLVCAITYVSDCVRNFCRPNDHHFSVPAINTKHDLRMIVLWFCDTSCCVHRNRQFLKNIIKAVRDLSNAKLRDTNHKKINDSGKSSILYCYDWMSLLIVRATAHSNRSHHCGHHDHSHFSFGAHNHTASKLSCIIFALYMFIHLRSLFRLFLNHNKIYFVISVNIKHTEKKCFFFRLPAVLGLRFVRSCLLLCANLRWAISDRPSKILLFHVNCIKQVHWVHDYTQHKKAKMATMNLVRSAVFLHIALLSIGSQPILIQ